MDADIQLFLKFVVSVVLIALVVSGSVSVLRALFFNDSADFFPDVKDSSDETFAYDEHEAFGGVEQR